MCVFFVGSDMRHIGLRQAPSHKQAREANERNMQHKKKRLRSNWQQLFHPLRQTTKKPEIQKKQLPHRGLAESGLRDH